MNEALSQVYGPYGSPVSKVFGPVINPRTYLRALHLVAMFPLGLAYFVGLVVTLSVGGSLIWTIAGPVVLIATLFLSRWAGDAEAWSIRRVAQIELRRPPTAIDLGQSWHSQLWVRLIDRKMDGNRLPVCAVPPRHCLFRGPGHLEFRCWSVRRCAPIHDLDRFAHSFRRCHPRH